MLQEFIAKNRQEILARARLRVSARNVPLATEIELTHGLPVFLDQLGEALRRATAHAAIDHEEIQRSAAQHGTDLFQTGLTVAQVVHDYGDLCQVITGLSVEQKNAISAEDFQTLNLSLDDAIAGAVTAYAHQRDRAVSNKGTERFGLLAHEMRNVLNSVILSVASIRKGTVGPGGSTGALLERNLIRLQTLIDRSLADVRLEAGMQNRERVPVWEVLEDVAIGATMVAQTRGVDFVVMTVDHAVIVEADRQILAAAIANLVENAVKFTRPRTRVQLRTTTTTSRVLIDVEDECGGLSVSPEKLLQPFVQAGRDRTGLGLGLLICSNAMKAIGGELHIRNLPGKGCIFTMDLPKQSPPPGIVPSRHP
jgi:signal transduction histidine kinase